MTVTMVTPSSVFLSRPREASATWHDARTSTGTSATWHEARRSTGTSATWHEARRSTGTSATCTRHVGPPEHQSHGMRHVGPPDHRSHGMRHVGRRFTGTLTLPSGVIHYHDYQGSGPGVMVDYA